MVTVAVGSAKVDSNLEEHDETTEVAIPSVRAAMTLGASAGEVDQSDLKIPYLSIAYGVGKLSEKFNPGDLVVGKEHLIASKGQRVKIVILSDVKYYKERLTQEDYRNGVRPQTFLTSEEVKKVGGTLDWLDGENGRRVPPTYGPAMDMKILIQKPEDLEQSIFGVELDNDFYAPAYFSVDKSAYTRVGKEVQTAKSLSLSNCGILGGVWELWTESQMIGSNPTVVPMIKLVSRTSDEFRNQVRELFG
jgi:hypothetical protein